MDARLPSPAVLDPHPLSLRRRDVRVAALLVAIACMSLGDLYMTMMFLTHGGMAESNPIARAVMLHNSPAMLAIWKLATVALSVGILFYVRRRSIGEAAAWAGCAVMTLLTLHWINYINETAAYAEVIAAAQSCPDLRAVVLDDWIRLD